MPIIKNQKRKKELQVLNKTMDNNINKMVKRKSIADYLIWTYQNLWLKIISKGKLSSLRLMMNRKRQGKKILQILFYLTQQKHRATYLKVLGTRRRQAKIFFAQNKPTWK